MPTHAARPLPTYAERSAEYRPLTTCKPDQDCKRKTVVVLGREEEVKEETARLK
jgi:hypothetical protein